MIKRLFNNTSGRRKISRARLARRGIIFVTALWVLVILVAMVLIFARTMRVEVIATGNRYSEQQASGIELGAEQYVTAAIDACNGDSILTLETPAEQIQVGTGYFWILQTYPDDDYTPAYGITDECSKLNLNVATSKQLALLPGMTQPIADSIVLWHGGTSATTSGQGADTSYYQGLARPYALKASPFESVEELSLIRDVTDTILWGADMNRNGVIEQTDANNETALAGGALASGLNAASDTNRGIFPYVTAWGVEPNTDANGKARINIANITDARTLGTALAKLLPPARAQQIAQQASRMRSFQNIFDFAAKLQIKQSELALIADSLTTDSGKTLTGKINVNTAPAPVLMCLGGLTQEDATSIVAARANNSASAGGSSAFGASTTTNQNTSDAWILGAISPAKAAAIGSFITGRSYFYSADIVAVSGDGHAFRRCKVVLDARSSPPIVVYRKDMTYLGWPLDPTILTTLKSGKPLPTASGYGTGGGNGLSQL
jgi:type II secretory pathway component PulK